MTIVVIGTLRFPPDRMETLRPHLLALVEATRRLDGCLAYDVAEDLFEPGLIRFSEVWPDATSLAAHLLAPHIGPWRKVCKEQGLLGRQFTAYEAHNPRNV